MIHSHLIRIVIIMSMIMSACTAPQPAGSDGAPNGQIDSTQVAVQPTQSVNQTAIGSLPTQPPQSAIPTETRQPTATVTVDDTIEDVPVDATEQIATLSTEQFGTQIADLATAQVLPTPAPAEGISAQSVVAGSGDVTSFYNTQVSYPDTMRINMELVFRELRIQPTPLSEEFQRAINDDIPTPVLVQDDLIQITPPPARDNRRVDNLPLYVIAELDCPASSFDGCEQLPVRRLNLQGINTWNWTIQPVQETSAQVDLSLRLYAADAGGEITDTNPIYVEDFVVEVRANLLASVFQQNAGAFVIAVSIMVVAIVALIALRSRRTPTVKSTGVSAFISYKRRGSWGIAEKIHDGLTQRGVDTFIDSKDLHEGDFEARLTSEIDYRDYVVVVLVPETLQSKWVVKEIEYALANNKTVIPVLVEGIKMESLDIPPEIDDLKKQNAVSLYQKYFEAGMDEILVFLKPLR